MLSRRVLRVLVLAGFISMIAATDTSAVQSVFQFTRLAANATTVVKSRSGILFAITINTKGTAANTLTLYDNTAASGTVIAIIDTTAAIGTLIYAATLNTGLTAVLATGGAADITVIAD